MPRVIFALVFIIGFLVNWGGGNFVLPWGLLLPSADSNR